MGNRELIRSIAHARLEAMQVPHINKIFGMGLKHSRHTKLQKTPKGRKMLEKLRTEYSPVWRRVTMGSLAKDGYNAQMGIKNRKYRIGNGRRNKVHA